VTGPVFTILHEMQNFRGGKVYTAIRRLSPSARVLKWTDPLSLAKCWPIMSH